MQNKEDLEVTIKEIENAPADTIKDFNVVINTGQSGVAEFITPTINGKLVAAIIDAENSIGISIGLADIESVVIWKDVNFFGTKYLPLRVQPVHPDSLVLKNAHDMWYLNDKLRIKIKGQFNTTVTFILRYC